MSTRFTKIAVTVAAACCVLGFVVYSSFGDAQYYKMVNEVMEKPEAWVGKDLKVHGFVEAGSIDEKIVDQRVTRTFILENHGRRITVRNHGPKPDTFKDLSEVVAEGKIQLEGDQYVLESTNLMAKCPSKYQGAAGNKHLGETQQPLFGGNK
jgi:cytochrome c-type biogenesis protein CcmE